MKIEKVTFTGADDSTSVADMARISATYPFVEWGILVSRSHQGSPRFPSHHWIKDLQLAAATVQLNLSLHVCGSWVRDLVLGEFSIPTLLLERFQRVQLNFHGQRDRYDRKLMFAALACFGERQIIFQLDGMHGRGHLEEIWQLDLAGELDTVPLHDASHGAGVLPGEWPTPYGADVLNGYAGGLGPDNVVSQVVAIGEAIKRAKPVIPQRVWIDMETKVRSDRGPGIWPRDIFDLDKVRAVCASVAPMVEQWS